MEDQQSHFFFEGVPAPPPRRARMFRKAGRWCLLAAIFLASFFFLPATEDPWHVNVFFFVGLLTLVAFICYLGCALDERRVEYPHAWLTLAFAAFLAVQGISAEFSLAPAQSFWGALRSPDSLAAFVIYALIFFLFSAFFRRDDIPKIGIAAGSGVLILTLINFFNPAGADSGWGILLAATVAALAVIRPGEPKGRAKLFFFAGVIIALAGLAILNYQFLWLALAAFIIVLAALRFGPREHFQYAFAIIVIALFFALIGPRLTGFLQTPRDTRPGMLATVTTAQGTLKSKNVLIGSGPSTFAFDFASFKPVAVNQTSFWSQTFNEGHDFAITLLATGGLLSFLLLLAMVILGIQPFLHIQLHDTDLSMAASASAFLLCALFLYPGFFAGFVILFALQGILIPEHARYSISFAEWPRLGSLAFSLAILAVAALSLGGIFAAGEQYAAAVLFAQSNSLAAAGNLSAAFTKINSALGLDRSDEYLRGASQIILAEANSLSSSKDPSAQAEVPAALASAVQSAQSAVLQNTNELANWQNLGSVYEAMMPVAAGTDDLAEASYKNAATLDPQNPTWDVAMARVLIESASLLSATPANAAANQSAIQAKRTSAEALLQQAIALKDDYADPRVLLVQLYLQEGNTTEAIQRVQELEQQNPLDPGIAFELGYLYYQDNQMAQAQQEFQVATILSPNYANARYFLGLIYAQQGITAQALDQFEKILALNPGNQQVIDIIANLEAGKPVIANANAPATSTLSGE